MLFNSYAFIFGFLPLTLGGFFLLGRFHPPLARGWLLLASLAFYAGWSLNYIWLILGSILFNYLAGLMIDTVRRGGRPGRAGVALAIGVTGNLALLGSYKYVDFFISNVNRTTDAGWPLLHLALPLGISFFTFTQIAYLVDARRGVARERSLVDYALFVTYFPHLLAGPIIHHKAVMPQFRMAEIFRPMPAAIAAGLTMFSIGLAKKVLIADSFVETVRDVFVVGHAHQFHEAWIGALAYTLQIYFDFSGYSDMAIGLSLMLGVTLPFNFNSPYKSLSIIDFWRRWHMTLSTFLRDYLYIPLGGSRHGEARRYLNLYLTMLLGGLWHGAGWTFVIWGALHGFYLVVNHAWRGVTGGYQAALPVRLLFGLVTFLAVVVGWVFFRAPDVPTAFSILSGMIGMGDSGVGTVASTIEVDRDVTWKIVLGLAIAFLLPNSQEIVGVKNIDIHGADVEARSGAGRKPRGQRRSRGSCLTWVETPQGAALFGVLWFVCLL
jgi:D-alanyl-lipoteichoic acid acyltransferase DltB (MBOAT superfamily)